VPNQILDQLFHTTQPNSTNSYFQFLLPSEFHFFFPFHFEFQNYLHFVPSLSWTLFVFSLLQIGHVSEGDVYEELPSEDNPQLENQNVARQVTFLCSCRYYMPHMINIYYFVLDQISISLVIYFLHAINYRPNSE
jgi:hypothetical protein